MGVLNVLGGIGLGAGLLGSLTSKVPKMNMGAMNQAYALINQQYGNINTYFDQANSAFETQYGHLYGQTMQDTVNSMAGSGVFESPVSQNALNRTQTALGEQYASGKSQLAGQRLSALGAIDQQKISYYQNLANIQYQRELAKSQQKNAVFGAIGSIGGALMGI